MNVDQIIFDEAEYLTGDQPRLGMEAGEIYYCDGGVLTCKEIKEDGTTFVLSRPNSEVVCTHDAHDILVPTYGEADFLEILRCAKCFEELISMLAELEFIH